MAVAVSLSDVAPDGRSQLVAKGMLNGTRRRSLTDPEPLEPGAVVELTIDLDATGWRFLPGHRIRVAIAAADWPNVWPTPEPGTLDGPPRPGAPSRLILPVVPDEGDAPPPSFAPSPVVVRHAAAFEPPPTWTVSEDALTGRVAVKVQLQTAHGTPAGKPDRARLAAASARWIPRDPAHAIGARLAPLFEHARRPSVDRRAPTWSWRPTPTTST